MSIRFERTPLILALVLAVAAIAMPFFVSVNLAFVFAGAALLMVAVSLFAGNRNSSDDEGDDSHDAPAVASPTVAFGPDATEAPRKLTAKEKKANKKAQRDAKKAAAQREKFEKKAQADAAKAAKKAAKGGGKGGEFDDFWVDTLKEMNATKNDDFAFTPPPAPEPAPVPVATPPAEPVFPGFASPFGEAVETAAETSATAEPTYERPAPVEETVSVYRADTEEIPVIRETVEAAVESESDAEDNDWVFEAYNDPNFTPPYTSNITLANNKVDTSQDDILDFEDADDPLTALPAEVNFVFQDDETTAGSPAGRLKALADRFQSLAADINHDWEDLMQAYEQRDALVRALRNALSENERLKKEMLEKSMETKEIDSVSERLEEARAEVARLYDDTRELSRLKYLNSQTTTRLRELRFALASQPQPDTALIAMVDQAIAESE